VKASTFCLITARDATEKSIEGLPIGSTSLYSEFREIPGAELLMKTFRIDTAARAVFIEYSGIVTNSDLAAGATEYGPLAAEYMMLVDLSKVEGFEVTTEGICSIGQRSGGDRVNRCAVIAPTDLAFGLARMFQTYSANPGVAVFRDAAGARLWLGLRQISAGA
jgi:hypothetical protein